jgi:hypothetical protein
MAMLNNISASQMGLTQQFAESGLATQAIDMLPKITKTLVKIAEAAGIRNADDYYPEIKPEELEALKQKAAQSEGQPPPEVQVAQMKMQADMQVQQAKMQGEQQKAQSDIAIQQQKDSASFQLEQQKMAMEFEFKREQLAAEIGLKREQLIAEIALKRDQIGAELELRRESNHLNAAVKASATSDVNVGGEPG